MDPEDIERRDFFLALRGYDQDEVNHFLAEVAAHQRALLEEIQSLRNRPAPVDPLAEVGASVTAILRTANESAERITAEAHAVAAELAARARSEAERLRQEAEQEARRILAEANEALDRARDQATRVIGDAEARGAVIETEAEQRGRDRALTMAEAHIGRLADAARSHSELRARLSEASDELQLVLLALGEPIADAEGALRDAVFEV